MLVGDQKWDINYGNVKTKYHQHKNNNNGKGTPLQRLSSIYFFHKYKKFLPFGKKIHFYNELFLESNKK